MWKSEFRQNYSRTSFSPTVPPFAARISRAVADGGTWLLKSKGGGKQWQTTPKNLPRMPSVPYRSHDWALVPAKPGLQGWILMNEWMKLHDIRPCNEHVIHTHYLYCVGLHFFVHQAVSYPKLSLPGIPQFLHTESWHYFETGHVVFHPAVNKLTHNRPPIPNNLSNWISSELTPRGF